MLVNSVYLSSNKVSMVNENMVDENRSLMNIIRQRQKNWLGHVLRSESLLRTVWEGRMEGTRTRGRQSDTMIDWMKSNDVGYEHIKKRAHDREDWRHWRPGSAWKGRAHKGRAHKRERESKFAWFGGLFFCCRSFCWESESDKLC